MTMLYSARRSYAAGRRLGRELDSDDIRAEAFMSVPCPTCDAPRGSWCVYTTTHPGTTRPGSPERTGIPDARAAFRQLLRGARFPFELQQRRYGRG